MNSRSPLLRHAIDAAVLSCLSIGALYATARIALAPRDPALGVAAVYAPWTTPEAAFVRTVEAGGRFVRFGGSEFIAIAIAESPDYPARLRAAGAWLVVDPQVIAACLTTFGRASSRT